MISTTYNLTEQEALRDYPQTRRARIPEKGDGLSWANVRAWLKTASVQVNAALLAHNVTRDQLDEDALLMIHDMIRSYVMYKAASVDQKREVARDHRSDWKEHMSLLRAHLDHLGAVARDVDPMPGANIMDSSGNPWGDGWSGF